MKGQSRHHKIKLIKSVWDVKLSLINFYMHNAVHSLKLSTTFIQYSSSTWMKEIRGLLSSDISGSWLFSFGVSEVSVDDFSTGRNYIRLLVCVVILISGMGQAAIPVADRFT